VAATRSFPIEVGDRWVVVISVARHEQGFAQTADGQVVVRRDAMNISLIGTQLADFVTRHVISARRARPCAHQRHCPGSARGRQHVRPGRVTSPARRRPAGAGGREIRRSIRLADTITPPPGFKLSCANLHDLVLDLARRGTVTNYQLRERLSLDRVEALRLLTDLVESGQLVRVGERRGAHYLLADWGGSAVPC
jgi:hypothetical protein